MTAQPPKMPRLSSASSNSDTHPQHSNQSAVPGPTPNYRPVGQPTPHINPKVFRPGDMTRLQEEQKESRHRDSLCSLCSSKNRKIYHHHFSSQQIRDFSFNYRSLGTFTCPVCKKEEPVELPTNVTRRVLLSSSTLFNIWEDPNLKVEKHFEMEAVVGARVRDMTRVLDMLYLRDKPNRLEVIVVCSINNIGDGQAPKDIFEEMKEMKALVEEHSQLYKHSPPSFVSFATCIMPPKFCSFYLPPNATDLGDWIPPPSFRNRAKEVEALNKLIKEMNEEAGLAYPGLHLYGMRFFKKSGTKQHKFDTRESSRRIWRESEVRRKLHFTSEVKLKIVESIMSIFAQNSKV